jgi:hypothetical protein
MRAILRDVLGNFERFPDLWRCLRLWREQLLRECVELLQFSFRELREFRIAVHCVGVNEIGAHVDRFFRLAPAVGQEQLEVLVAALPRAAVGHFEPLPEPRADARRCAMSTYVRKTRCAVARCPHCSWVEVFSGVDREALRLRVVAETILHEVNHRSSARKRARKGN